MARSFAWGGLVLALLVAATVRWTPPTRVEDLRPRPDALEYEEAARNLIAGAGYCLVFDGGCYPPRYPPGFSVLLMPGVWLSGGQDGSGIWTVMAFALAGVAAVWAIGLATGGPASAVAAALLLALSPLHARWSRAVMADVPAATITTILVLGAILAARRSARPLAWLALGLGVGLSALLRATSLVLVPALALAALAPRDGGRPRATRLLAVGTGVLVGVLPSIAYGIARFGAPLASGYDYWVPGHLFAWRYLTGRPGGGGTEANLPFYVRQLSGWGSLYPWTVAVLAIVGTGLGFGLAGPARLLVTIVLATLGGLLAIHLPFFWQWDRFLLPVLPLVLAVAALPVGGLGPRAVRVAGVVLVVFTLARACLTPAAFAPPDKSLHEVAVLRAIAARVERNAVLIAHSTVFLVSRVFRDGTDRLWIPVGRCEHRQRVRDLGRVPVRPADAPQNWLWDVIGVPLVPEDVEGAVTALLASGRPVYFAPMQSGQSPLVAQVDLLLAERFRVEPVVTIPPTGLTRVRVKD
jgi:4-amino-4-deoxy-L-arabinose transferase-like glycosyltransferase